MFESQAGGIALWQSTMKTSRPLARCSISLISVTAHDARIMSALLLFGARCLRHEGPAAQLATTAEPARGSEHNRGSFAEFRRAASSR